MVEGKTGIAIPVDRAVGLDGVGAGSRLVGVLALGVLLYGLALVRSLARLGQGGGKAKKKRQHGNAQSRHRQLSRGFEVVSEEGPGFELDERSSTGPRA